VLRIVDLGEGDAFGEGERVANAIGAALEVV